jgi:cytochrome c biogenesis protein CcmG/thiol:disulfide interchange protein DsbE
VSPDAPRGHPARWIALAVLVIAAGLTAVLAASPSATVAQVQSALVGHQAPQISGPTIDGTDFSLPKAPGRYVVLNFFASWCVPCQNEGPELVAFHFHHQATGDATLVSVVFDDTVSAARAYQQDTLGATWPTLTDPGGKLALDYGVEGQPTTFIIAPDGRVVAHIVSPVTAAELDTLIAEAEATHP